jgi:murein hydrolase activator
MESRFSRGWGLGAGGFRFEARDWAKRKPFSAISAVSALIVVTTAVLSAQPSDRERAEALARRAADRMLALQREADSLANEEHTLLGDLRKLEIEREIKSAELKQADAAVARAQSEFDAATVRMTTLESQAAAERPELRARLVELYKLGQARYLRLLFSTADLRRIGQATRTVAALGKIDRDRVAAHQRTLADLKTTRATLEQSVQDAAASRATAAKAEASVQRAAQARSDLIRDIDRRRDLNAQLAGELLSAQQKLQGSLRELAAGSAPATAASLPLRPFRGDLDWPASGPVRRRFGNGPTPNGMEIAATEGANVQAIHEGVVAFAGTFAGFGNLVIVEHGPQTFSLYGDLLEVGVSRGSRLERGQTLGTVGATPAGPAGLYFELRVDGQPVDPLQWLRKR